jgi:hypothetical protein
MRQTNGPPSPGLARGKYLMCMPLLRADALTGQVLSRAGRYCMVNKRLQIKEVVIGDGERRLRYVLCFNPEEAQRQQARRRHAHDHLQAELAAMGDAAQNVQSKRVAALRSSSRYGKYPTPFKILQGVSVVNPSMGVWSARPCGQASRRPDCLPPLRGGSLRCSRPEGAQITRPRTRPRAFASVKLGAQTAFGRRRCAAQPSGPCAPRLRTRAAGRPAHRGSCITEVVYEVACRNSLCIAGC